MKGLFLLVLLFLFTSGFSQVSTNSEEIGVMQGEAAEELPEFPGGIMEMMKFVRAHTKIPKQSIDNNINGKCNVKFLVNKDGSISEVSVLKGIPNCPDCEAEAIRVIKSMPKWKPGKLAGKPVSLYYNLPVTFSPEQRNKTGIKN